MKLKSSVATGVMIACLFLFGTTLHAQGLYSSNNDKSTTNNNNSSTSDTKSVSSTSSSSGGIFKGMGPGGDKDSDPGGTSPIGEGVLFLSLLSGAYAFVKRNKGNKHED